MKTDLTEKQKMIYNYLKETIRTKGYPPSVREICAATGLKSTSTVHVHLENLEKKGYIRRETFKNRSIEILENSFYNFAEETVNVPIVGRVAAGEPILAVENIEDYFPVLTSYLRGLNEVFMLRIKGDSMIDAGIYDKDLVLVQKQPYAYDGEIIIALLNDSATCKRYFNNGSTVTLKSENNAYEPIVSNHVDVIGKVVGLFRMFIK